MHNLLPGEGGGGANLHHLESISKLAPGCKFAPGHRSHGQKYTRGANCAHGHGLRLAYRSQSHYANTPMQYTAIINGCKNVHFHMFFFLNIFLIFAQIIDCGYTRLNEAVLTSTHNQCFGAKIRKKYTPVNPSFTI